MVLKWEITTIILLLDVKEFVVHIVNNIFSPSIVNVFPEPVCPLQKQERNQIINGIAHEAQRKAIVP